MTMYTNTKLALAAALVAGFASAGMAQDISDATVYERMDVRPYGTAHFDFAYGAVEPGLFQGRTVIVRRAPLGAQLDWQAEQNWFDRASEGPVG
jgi:hypothetical protein